jgi:hypothetical protein
VAPQERIHSPSVGHILLHVLGAGQSDLYFGQADQPRLTYGDILRLRLTSSEVVEYKLVDIARLQRHQIEVLSSLSPSLTIILHSEHSGERYMLIGNAVQPCPGGFTSLTPTTPAVNFATPTVSPTITDIPTSTALPTIALTPTPWLDFTSPAAVTVIVTDTQTVINQAADLQLTVVGCSRVAQIG